MEWIAQYWLEVCFGLVVAGIGGAVKFLQKRLREQACRQEAVEHGIQALLRDRIVQAYYHYADRGWITLHGLEAVSKMYREYHNLGGNGAVTKLMEDMEEFEVRDQ